MQHTPPLDLSFLDDTPVAPSPAIDPWDAPTALAVMSDADGLVEQLAVRGSDATIQAAVIKCVNAHGRKDMAGVRAACEAIRQRAETLARLAAGVRRSGTY